MKIRHGRVSLELHTLQERPGPSLLLLHSLYSSSREWSSDASAARWPGRVYALDFSGHGDSDRLVGGGYYPELLVGDADAALSQTGATALAGSGLGAYVALLLAGARCPVVQGALLLPGAGMDALPEPDYGCIRDPGAVHALESETRRYVHVLENDVRPPEYARQFAQAARRLLLLEDGAHRPAWWQSAAQVAHASKWEGDRGAAITALARALRQQP